MVVNSIYKNAVLLLRRAGIPSPELDVSVLLNHVIGHEKSVIFSHPEMPLTNSQGARFRRYIKRRQKGEPVAYITHHKEFYGLDFYVNKNVLIPRPETENLLEEAVKFAQNWKPKSKDSKLSILDMGTGSGCMIIYLALQLDNAGDIHLTASDISQKALTIAKKNSRNFGVQNQIHFFHSDLFKNKRIHKKYDLIMANLPYVPDSRKPEETSTIRFEPKIAIFANDNGCEIIKRFLAESAQRLSPNGIILLELDPRNINEIADYAKIIFPTAKIEVSKDLACWERYLKINL